MKIFEFCCKKFLAQKIIYDNILEYEYSQKKRIAALKGVSFYY